MPTVANAVAAGEPAGVLADVQFCVTPRHFPWQPKARVLMQRVDSLWTKPHFIERTNAARILRTARRNGRRLGTRNVVVHADGNYEILTPAILITVLGGVA